MGEKKNQTEGKVDSPSKKVRLLGQIRLDYKQVFVLPKQGGRKP